MSDRKKIEAVVTTYYRCSHADILVTKSIKCFPTEAGLIEPQVNIVSIYMDQVDERDIGIYIAREHGIPLYPSIQSDLTLGGRKLAMDGVLLIGEHGNYACNEKGHNLYPRHQLFDQVCGVFASVRPIRSHIQ